MLLSHNLVFSCSTVGSLEDLEPETTDRPVVVVEAAAEAALEVEATVLLGAMEEIVDLVVVRISPARKFTILSCLNKLYILPVRL